MTYEQMRPQAQTGDVLLVKGNRLVRFLTSESYSHTALLVVAEDGGLWVYEFVEGVGYQAMPASQWFADRTGVQVWFGKAPAKVTLAPEKVAAVALGYRDKSGLRKKYGWLSLLKVWAAQITGWRIKTYQKVCSTFVQQCWEATGYRLKQTADPGDIAESCQALIPVEARG